MGSLIEGLTFVERERKGKVRKGREMESGYLLVQLLEASATIWDKNCGFRKRVGKKERTKIDQIVINVPKANSGLGAESKLCHTPVTGSSFTPNTKELMADVSKGRLVNRDFTTSPTSAKSNLLG